MTNITLYQHDLPDDLDLPGDIAIDTETMGLQTHRDRLCLVQLSNGDGNAHLVQLYREDYNKAPNLKALLDDKSRQFIMHYARFDIAAVKHYLGVEMADIYCTKIASKLVRTYTDRHGLKELLRELLHVDVSKQQQSSDWGNENLSKSQRNYAANDVLYLHQLRGILQNMLVRENLEQYAKDCFAFLPSRVALDLAGYELDIFSHAS